VVAARRPPRRWTLAVLLVAFLALAAVGSISRFYTDLLWFREIDKTSLFWGMLRTKFFIGLLAGLGTAVIVGVNLWVVERLAPRYGLTVVARPQVERARATPCSTATSASTCSSCRSCGRCSAGCSPPWC